MSILNTSVSGMMANQNWLSSISQNVANANTTGYKDVETDFSSIVDQISNEAPDFGGIRSMAVSLNALQGNVVASQTTTNLGIQGAGFFVVSNAAGALYLTRDGSFAPDASGNLVNDGGYYLMANNIQAGQISTAANSLSGLQKVNVVNAGQTATPTTTASITANLPATDAVVTPNPPSVTLPSANTANSTYSEETSLVVYDNLGGSHTINIYFTNTGPNNAGDPTWEVDAFDAKDATNGGFPYSSGALAPSGATEPLATGTMTFNPANGQLLAGSPLSIPVPGGATMSLDLSNMTQLETGFNVTAATANGNAPASLQGVSIAQNGTLSFTYSNGTEANAYGIPLANVESPDNLGSVSGNACTATVDSGPIFLGTANEASLGAIESSSLESSTVNLATELTNMIEAQSSYQTNSKVFQTGADILDILNGLKS
jgi:flagellar hook protein FlgE